MKHLLQLLLVCGLIAYSAPAMQASPGAELDCIHVDFYEVECLSINSQGLVTYRVNFKFDYVKPGTNFIRIHESGLQGTTHTYPFRNTMQSVTGTMNSWDYPERCFTIDVYDVLPNGKVTKCSIIYCVWANCGGGESTLVDPPNHQVGDQPYESSVAGETSEVGVAYVALAPNPATDAVEVLIDVPSYDPSASLDIIDLNGNVVASLATAMPQGALVIPAQLNNLPAGVYMVRMLHAGSSVVSPLQVIK